MSYKFGIIGCQHGHIAAFVKQMLDQGHRCTGMYDSGNTAMAESIAARAEGVS